MPPPLTTCRNLPLSEIFPYQAVFCQKIKIFQINDLMTSPESLNSLAIIRRQKLTHHIKFAETNMMSQYSPTQFKFRTKANHRWCVMKLSTNQWKYIMIYVKPKPSQTKIKIYNKTSQMHLNLKEKMRKTLFKKDL